VATIANDNLQDLKTGQLVGATPWKQQIALVLGVVFGRGDPAGAQPAERADRLSGRAGRGPDALAAPQASLIASIAQGVLTGQLEWA
jgi:putative OPT family oligopeptide transporter